MHKPQSRPIWVDINCQHMAHNLLRVRDMCPSAKVMAVVKADGYGHGMLAAARALEAADAFAVNSMDDVMRLRSAGITKQCHLLAPHLSHDTLSFCANNDCVPTIFDHSHFALLESLPATSRLDVWLKVDTGMGRLGFAPDELHFALERLRACNSVARVHLMSHLAAADDRANALNTQQLALFKTLSTTSGLVDHSVLNSAGVVGFASHAYDWVRPGVMLYGVSPSAHVSRAELKLKPAMNFKSRVISIKSIPAGHGVGYASTFVAPAAMRIAIVAAGYGDGYPRHAPTGTPVWLNGKIVSLLGRVSMDMLVLDLRSLDAQGVVTEVGDEVQLWGEHNPVEEVAAYCGTIAYELTCGILPRVERRLL